MKNILITIIVIAIIASLGFLGYSFTKKKGPEIINTNPKGTESSNQTPPELPN